MSARRPCAACGGSKIEQRGDSFRIVCYVCDGRGWQSDAMPVSDHEADAETLRLAREELRPEYLTGRIDAYEYVLAGNMLADGVR